jgi:hypothetical protein
MRVAIVLLLAILAGTQARKIPPTGNLFSRFEPHIRQASDQQDATKLCAIREELEKDKINSEKARLIEFLDNTASTKFAFDPSACPKEINMDTFEKTNEPSQKFGESLQETKQNSGIDVNSTSLLKGFGQDGKTNEDLSPTDIQALLEPFSDVLDLESSRVTEEEKEDNSFDQVGMYDSISNTESFVGCDGCQEWTNDTMFAPSMNDKEQTSSEIYKLAATVIGIIFIIVILLVILCFGIKSCCGGYVRSENVPHFQDQTRSEYTSTYF